MMLFYPRLPSMERGLGGHGVRDRLGLGRSTRSSTGAWTARRPERPGYVFSFSTNDCQKCPHAASCLRKTKAAAAGILQTTEARCLAILLRELMEGKRESPTGGNGHPYSCLPREHNFVVRVAVLMPKSVASDGGNLESLVFEVILT